MTRKVLDFKGLKALGIRYSRVHIDRKEDDGTFPQSFKLGAYRNSPRVWWEDQVLKWLEDCSERY